MPPAHAIHREELVSGPPISPTGPIVDSDQAHAGQRSAATGRRRREAALAASIARWTGWGGALGVLGADPRPANTTPADPGAGVLVAPDPIKEAIPKSGLAIELVELVRAPRSALVASPSRRVDLRFGQGQAGDVYVMSKRDGWIRRMQAVPCGTFRCDIEGLRYIASYPDLILAFGANAAAGQSHLTTYGQFEGRNPNASHVVRYLARYPDLRAAFASDPARLLRGSASQSEG